MSNLETAWKDAEDKALKLQADRDQAIAKVRERYDKRLREANAAAAKAQKAYLDSEAAAALVGRADAEQVAKDLGLELP
jgi:hypothetical protein